MHLSLVKMMFDLNTLSEPQVCPLMTLITFLRLSMLLSWSLRIRSLREVWAGVPDDIVLLGEFGQVCQMM